MRYEGRTAIVTGGTKGIGEACVEVFAREGASVWFCGLEDDLGRAVEARVRAQARGEVRFTRCDVTDHRGLTAFVEDAAGATGRIDCLINNAGWHPPHRPIDGFTVDEFRSILELNVISVFVAAKVALPHLRRVRGSIVNIASLVATIGQHHATTYVATKGAVLGLTKALAVDEAVHGVRVNSVSPGNIFTPLWQEAIDASPTPERTRAAGEAAQPLARMGTPREVAELCLFLAADASFSTGADHIVSGGAELGYGNKVN